MRLLQGNRNYNAAADDDYSDNHGDDDDDDNDDGDDGDDGDDDDDR